MYRTGIDDVLQWRLRARTRSSRHTHTAHGRVRDATARPVSPPAAPPGATGPDAGASTLDVARAMAGAAAVGAVASDVGSRLSLSAGRATPVRCGPKRRRGRPDRPDHGPDSHDDSVICFGVLTTVASSINSRNGYSYTMRSDGASAWVLTTVLWCTISIN